MDMLAKTAAQTVAPHPYHPVGTPLPAMLRGKPIDEIQLGDSFALDRTLRQQDLELFALISGDVNPQHLDADFAAGTFFKGIIAHGMWGGALISAVLGSFLPGPGTIYLSQNLQFKAPVRVGDTLTVRVTVTDRNPEKRRLTLACTCTNQAGEVVIEGEAKVMPPKQAIDIAAAKLPRVMVG